MDLQVWSLYLITGVVLAFTPGPAVLLILATALRDGARRTVAATLGILAANGMYFALSATTLGGLLAASYDTLRWLRWAGAGYLFYLGVRMLLASRRPSAPSRLEPADRSDQRRFARAFLTQASNPKALVFFTAFLPQFVNPGRPLPLQLTILGLTTTLVEAAVLTFYSLVASQARLWSARPGFAVWTNRAAGALLLGAGLALASIRNQ